MNEKYKKVLYVFLACILLLGTGYYLGGRTNVSDHGNGADRVRNDIQGAQNAAAGATESLNRADNANQDAQDTTDEIERGNKKLQGSAGTSAEAIDRFGAIMEEIRNQPAKN